MYMYTHSKAHVRYVLLFGETMIWGDEVGLFGWMKWLHSVITKWGTPLEY